MIDKEKIITTIDYILDNCYNFTYIGGTPMLKRNTPQEPQEVTKRKVDEMYSLTLSILTKIYGQNSDTVKNFQLQLSEFIDPKARFEYPEILEVIVGKLNFLKYEIERDLLNTFEKEISGEVYGDFLRMAREAIENNAKDTAAVLACAALEDALKRFAKLNNLEIEDKAMNEVSNSLKSIGLLKGPQGS